MIIPLLTITGSICLFGAVLLTLIGDCTEPIDRNRQQVAKNHARTLWALYIVAGICLSVGLGCKHKERQRTIYPPEYGIKEHPQAINGNPR
jgi:hypothetical protein